MKSRWLWKVTTRRPLNVGSCGRGEQTVCGTSGVSWRAPCSHTWHAQVSSTRPAPVAPPPSTCHLVHCPAPNSHPLSSSTHLVEERGKHAAHAVAQPRVKVVEHQLGAVAGRARVVLEWARKQGKGREQ